MHDPSPPLFAGGLYGITPDWTDEQCLLEAIEAACRGGMRVLQWRRKGLARHESLPRALIAKALCHHYGCQFIINDDVTLALDCAADGVHIGRDDGTVEQLQKAAQEAQHPLLIGVSCYNDLSLAQQAIDQGVDYVAFGAVFTSRVKPDAVSAPLSLFAQAKAYRDSQYGDGPSQGAQGNHSHWRYSASPRHRTALVAIGGITTHNAAEVVAAGAESVAVISGLFEPRLDGLEARLDGLEPRLDGAAIEQCARSFSNLF